MKFNVTPELAVLIKTIRAHNRVSSKELAEHIGKSYSYISKLESGDVKTIAEDDLTKALSFINGGGDFFADVLPATVRTFTSFLDPACLVNQLWLIHYDVVLRPLRVPDEMTDDMNRLMEAHGITVDQLVEMINSNVDSEVSDSNPANTYFTMNSHGSTRLLIRCQVERREVADILTKANPETHYYLLQYLVYNLLRLADYPEYRAKLPSDKAALLLKKSADYHDRFNTRSLTNFTRLLASNDYLESLSNQRHKVVSSLNTVDEFTLDGLMELLREAMLHDPVGVTQSLESFQNNLNWDMAFILKIIGIPFPRLGSLSYAQKKRLLASIDQLIEKCDQLSDFEKTYEVY